MEDKDKGSAEVVDRKDGYYWVKFDGDCNWFIAEWDRGCWWTMLD